MSYRGRALKALGCCLALLSGFCVASCKLKNEPVRLVDSDKRDAWGESLDQTIVQAAALAAAGKYEDALEKHVWFHNHALEVDPNYRGVRRSFALEYWVKLGEKYPPALEKLIAIRDEATAKLESGETSWGLFADVQSINSYLREPEKTVALFKRIESADPAFAGTIYGRADEELISAGEYALARKYLGDPLRHLEKARQNFESGIAFSKRQSAPETQQLMRRTTEQLFEAKAVRIIVVLAKTGDAKLARDLQSKALAVLDSPGIKSAL